MTVSPDTNDFSATLFCRPSVRVFLFITLTIMNEFLRPTDSLVVRTWLAPPRVTCHAGLRFE